MLSAQFRQQAEDFFVEENLGFELSGEGEHLCLYIEKTGNNTHWVSEQLAKFAGISERDVGVCGRKDRHAVTRQWFSLYDPERKSLGWKDFSVEGINILKVTRHIKKLRPGDHQSNHFVIRLRQVCWSSNRSRLKQEDKSIASKTIQQILQQGVPNYFGAQRFGREANNLSRANEWLLNGQEPPRKQRSMVLSAARAYLFNQVLAYRVAQQSWHTVLEGEQVIDGKPSGPLWGRGRLQTTDTVLALEQTALQQWLSWCERMEHRGLKQERRALLLLPSNTAIDWYEDDMVLSFTLPVGTFATAVLAEITELESAH